MEAASRNEHDDHTYTLADQRLLKTSVIYGANASGKSNLFKALVFMKDLVLNSSKESQAGEEIPVEPFLLNSLGRSEATEMEVIIIIGDELYRYGFAAFSHGIEREWLFVRNSKARSREINLFTRERNQIINLHKRFREGSDRIIEFLRGNSLFLSLIAQFNGEISSKIVKVFWNTNIWNIESFMPVHTSVLLKDNLIPNDWVKEFLVKSDVGIKSFSIREEEMGAGKISNSMVAKAGSAKFINLFIQTEHEYYDTKDEKFKSEWFDMNKQESEGTKKFFSLSGLLYHTLKNGGILFIDEIENSLHPQLTKIIIRLFRDQETNPLGAQLVFTTHNTSTLDKDFFRRDEIWFTEKDSNNSTDLYSLIEYKLPKGKARKDSSYSKDYIRGKYGAVPYLKYSDFVDLFIGNS